MKKGEESLKHKLVLQGVPVTSNRGALGWSTVVLIFGEKKILFDTGSYGDRKNLLLGLKKLGVRIEEIDIVFISHLHFDHCLNIELFESAEILVSKRELEYVLSGEYKNCLDPYIPLTVVKNFSKIFHLISDNEEIIKGIRTILLPGHTPGNTGLLIKDKRVILTGDAVKSARDFINNFPPPSFYSRTEALRSYEIIKRKADLIIPGHDRPFRMEGKRVKYTENKDNVTIKAYYNPKGEAQKIQLL